MILITLDLGNWGNALAKLRNLENTMSQWNVTFADSQKKPRKRQQGKTLAVASVIIYKELKQIRQQQAEKKARVHITEVSIDTILFLFWKDNDPYVPRDVAQLMKQLLNNHSKIILSDAKPI